MFETKEFQRNITGILKLYFCLSKLIKLVRFVYQRYESISVNK